MGKRAKAKRPKRRRAKFNGKPAAPPPMMPHTHPGMYGPGAGSIPFGAAGQQANLGIPGLAGASAAHSGSALAMIDKQIASMERHLQDVTKRMTESIQQLKERREELAQSFGQGTPTL